MSEIEFTKDDLRRAHAFPRQITREGISSLAAFAIRLLAERDAIMDKWAIESDESLTECVERNLNGAIKRFKTAEAERDALRECVKAADDVKGRDEFNHESEWASYDAARAKVKL